MKEYHYKVLAYTDYAEGYIIDGVIDAEDLAAALIAARKDARTYLDEHLRIIEVLDIFETDTSNSIPDLPGLDEQMADPEYDDFMTELLKHNRECIIDGFEFEDIGDFIDGKA